MEEHFYDDEFFDMTIRTEEPSAHIVIDTLLEHYRPKSVVDIGCGCGIYMKEFLKRGVSDVLGFDGSEWALKKSMVPDGFIKIHNLQTSLKLNRKFDMCICIEVIEHIDSEFSDKVLNTLCSLSDIVVFTAAVPGQLGVNHINLKPHEYWIDQFNVRGYVLDELTYPIRKLFERDNVVWWVTNNFMVFKRCK
jgi:SAM-dependent methyltransferase